MKSFAVYRLLHVPVFYLFISVLLPRVCVVNGQNDILRYTMEFSFFAIDQAPLQDDIVNLICIQDDYFTRQLERELEANVAPFVSTEIDWSFDGNEAEADDGNDHTFPLRVSFTADLLDSEADPNSPTIDELSSINLIPNITSFILETVWLLQGYWVNVDNVRIENNIQAPIEGQLAEATCGSSSASAQSGPPTTRPQVDPTPNPTPKPTPNPTKKPTPSPSPKPTPEPTPNPSKKPTPQPSPNPTLRPSPAPSKRPTLNPTPQPTLNPTPKPTLNPTTVKPTLNPTPSPTNKPTPNPSQQPTLNPTKSPTLKPTMKPTPLPPDTGVLFALEYAFQRGTITREPTEAEVEDLICQTNIFFARRIRSEAQDDTVISFATNIDWRFNPNTVFQVTVTFFSNSRYGDTGTLVPSQIVSEALNLTPGEIQFYITNHVWETTLSDNLFKNTLDVQITDTINPAQVPPGRLRESDCPISTPAPTTPSPTLRPTLSPTTAQPTLSPTQKPTAMPSATPSLVPSGTPTTASPTRPGSTRSPTKQPTPEPTKTPTLRPTPSPTLTPTLLPTLMPSKRPTMLPTMRPSQQPTDFPTASPSLHPSMIPGKPTVAPSPALITARVQVTFLVSNLDGITSPADIRTSNLELSWPVFVQQTINKVDQVATTQNTNNSNNNSNGNSNIFNRNQATNNHSLRQSHRRRLEVSYLSNSAVISQITRTPCASDVPSEVTCHVVIGTYSLLLSEDEDPELVQNVYTTITNEAIANGAYEEVLKRVTPNSPLFIGLPPKQGPEPVPPLRLQIYFPEGSRFPTAPEIEILICNLHAFVETKLSFEKRSSIDAVMTNLAWSYTEVGPDRFQLQFIANSTFSSNGTQVEQAWVAVTLTSLTEVENQRLLEDYVNNVDDSNTFVNATSALIQEATFPPPSQGTLDKLECPLPTPAPTISASPTLSPAPSRLPSFSPAPTTTTIPSALPTTSVSPSAWPSVDPSDSPSMRPSMAPLPTRAPVLTQAPSMLTKYPTSPPSPTDPVDGIFPIRTSFIVSNLEEITNPNDIYNSGLNVSWSVFAEEIIQNISTFPEPIIPRRRLYRLPRSHDRRRLDVTFVRAEIEDIDQFECEEGSHPGSICHNVKAMFQYELHQEILPVVNATYTFHTNRGLYNGTFQDIINREAPGSPLVIGFIPPDNNNGGLAGWVIFLIVLSTLTGLCVPIALLYFFYSKRQRGSHTDIVPAHRPEEEIDYDFFVPDEIQVPAEEAADLLSKTVTLEEMELSHDDPSTASDEESSVDDTGYEGITTVVFEDENESSEDESEDESSSGEIIESVLLTATAEVEDSSHESETSEHWTDEAMTLPNQGETGTEVSQNIHCLALANPPRLSLQAPLLSELGTRNYTDESIMTLNWHGLDGEQRSENANVLVPGQDLNATQIREDGSALTPGWDNHNPTVRYPASVMTSESSRESNATRTVSEELPFSFLFPGAETVNSVGSVASHGGSHQNDPYVDESIISSLGASEFHETRSNYSGGRKSTRRSRATRRGSEKSRQDTKGKRVSGKWNALVQDSGKAPVQTVDSDGNSSQFKRDDGISVRSESLFVDSRMNVSDCGESKRSSSSSKLAFSLSESEKGWSVGNDASSDS